MLFLLLVLLVLDLEEERRGGGASRRSEEEEKKKAYAFYSYSYAFDSFNNVDTFTAVSSFPFFNETVFFLNNMMMKH